MSERAGSVRDARFLSGADIGRTILLPNGERHIIRDIWHDGINVEVCYKAEPDDVVLFFSPHEAVTITGADEAESPVVRKG
ncbi:MAG: hypothetical protein LBE25_13585 [Arthrobacter sp.]|jgi:hypothetical protein|nr:hypothetical protein [Arthrobacter sp.]